MLHVRRLVELTELRLCGAANLTGDVPVAALAVGMPPNLRILELRGSPVRFAVLSWHISACSFVLVASKGCAGDAQRCHGRLPASAEVS